MVPGFQENVSQQQAFQKAQVIETASPVKGYSQNQYNIDSTVFYWSKQSQIQGAVEGNSTYQVDSTEEYRRWDILFQSSLENTVCHRGIKHNAI